MNEWRELKLGDVINLKRGYDLPSRLRSDGDFPIFSSSGISGFHTEGKVQGPGVITGRYGTIGQVFFAKSSFWPLNTTLYVEDFKGNDEVFIYYLLKQINWEQFNDKSAVPGINRNDVHQEDVIVPPLSEQKAIAAVLSSLDDKIDLLQRQNKTLEALAQTLFRHWFVDGVQDTWVECSLYDAIDLIGGGTPKTDEESYWNGDIYWLSGGDITSRHKNFIVSSEKKITKLGLNNSATKLLPKFSTVISARGTVGKYCILGEPMAFSQTSYGIQPKIDNCFFFTYLLIDHSVTALKSASYGSVFDTITTQTFRNHQINLPTFAEVREFEEQVTPYFLKMHVNQRQICTLEKLRNILLPKLVNGEIRVSEIANYETHDLFDRVGYLATLFANSAHSDMPETNVPRAWFAIPETLYQLSEQPFPTPVGQTIYQKICYVLTDEGVNTGFTFAPRNFGPHSNDAGQALSLFERKGIIERVSIGRMTEVRVQELYKSQRASIMEELKQFQPMIARTVELFNHIKDTDHAEEIATILFSARQLEHKLSQRNISRNELHKYMVTWKPQWDRDSKRQRLDRAINGLVKLGFVSVS